MPGSDEVLASEQFAESVWAWVLQSELPLQLVLESVCRHLA